MIRAAKGAQNSSDVKDERKKYFLLRSGQIIYFPACQNHRYYNLVFNISREFEYSTWVLLTIVL